MVTVQVVLADQQVQQYFMVVREFYCWFGCENYIVEERILPVFLSHLKYWQMELVHHYFIYLSKVKTKQIEFIMRYLLQLRLSYSNNLPLIFYS